MHFLIAGTVEACDRNLFVDEQDIPINKIKKRKLSENNEQSSNKISDRPELRNNIKNTATDQQTQEALENAKALMAQYAAALKNGSEETGSKDLAVLQSTLHTLQHQQVFQMQLIHQLQYQLKLSKDKPKSIKNSPNTPPEEEIRTDTNQNNSEIENTNKKPDTPTEGPDDIVYSDSIKPLENVTKYPSRNNSPSLSHISSSLASSIITNHDSTLPNVTNSLQMLEKRAEEVLDSASHGLLAGNLIDELAFRNKLNGDGTPDDPALKHRCRYCGKIFGSDSALQIHLRSHTGERPFKCNMCPSSFTTKGNLKVHYQRHTQPFPQFDLMDPNQPLKYAFLSKPMAESNFMPIPNFQKPSDLFSKLHSIAETKYPIDLCKNGLENSENNNGTKPRDSVAEQDTGIGKKKYEQNFISTNLESKSYLPMSMNEPGYGFARKSKAWENLIEITKTPKAAKLEDMVENSDVKLGDPNKCPICQRTLSCRSALRQHYRTHTGERPFRCKLCGRAFTTKGNLKTHISVHKLKPFMTTVHKCPICHKQYSNGVVLQQHINVHTGEPTELTLDQIRAAEVRDYPNSMPNDNFGSESSSGGDFADSSGVEADLDSKDQKKTIEEDKHSEVTNYKNELRNHNKSRTPTEISNSEEIEDVDCNQMNKIPENHRNSPNPVNLSSKSPSETVPNMKIFSKFPSIFPGSLQSSPSTMNNNIHLLPPSLLSPSTPFNPLGFPNLFGSPSPTGALMMGPGLYNPLGECVAGIRGNTTCNICLKTFACHSALEIHYRSHTKERPYKCTICDRGFSTKVK